MGKWQCPKIIQSKLADIVDEIRGDVSAMKKKIDAWDDFLEREEWGLLRLVSQEKT